MQFVILKDDYEVDKYGIEIKQEELPKINGQVPAGKIIIMARKTAANLNTHYLDLRI